MSLLVLVGSLLVTADDGDRFPPPNALPVRKDLPDPLLFLDGRRVASKEEWFSKRRPELQRLFEHYMYGRLPATRPVTGRVLFEDSRALGGRAIVKEIEVTVQGAELSPFRMLLVLPGRTLEPPLFLGLNFCGNHAVLDDERIAIPTVWMYDRQPGVENNRASAAGRGKQKEVWPVDKILDAGFGLATIYCGEIEPDEKDVRGGLYKSIPALGEPDEHWGRVAVWAWGLSRAIDYLAARPVVSKQIAVVGHSRLGKTALLAGAFDQRIALVVANQSGCGGAAPSRGSVGESVERINTAFPAWFCGNFKKFNKEPQRLPFDQNALVALCAPRPVLFTAAEEDTWANPSGQFEVLRAADPVYRYLGAGGLSANDEPAGNQLSNGTLGYFIRPGKHSMTPADWTQYLAFSRAHPPAAGK